jgi:hypothetical protein
MTAYKFRGQFFYSEIIENSGNGDYWQKFKYHQTTLTNINDT